MNQILNTKYSVIITEVDKRNERSLNAHLAIGFKKLYDCCSKNQDWEILIWDIKSSF